METNTFIMDFQNCNFITAKLQADESELMLHILMMSRMCSSLEGELNLFNE